MAIRSADDIFRDREARQREQGRKALIDDIDKTIDEVFDRQKKKVPNKVVKKFTIGKFFISLLAILIFLTLFFGCIWLLKFFITDLFGW